jgi:hypothetical protein
MLALATATPSDTADLLKLFVDGLLRLLRRVFLLMTIPQLLTDDLRGQSTGLSQNRASGELVPRRFALKPVGCCGTPHERGQWQQWTRRCEKVWPILQPIDSRLRMRTRFSVSVTM